MSEWSENSLGCLAVFRKGRKVDTADYQERGYSPYLGADAISGGEVGEYADATNAVMATERDVLMLWDGERSGLVGKGRCGVVSSTTTRLSPRKGIDSSFLYYALDRQFEWIQGRRTGTGVPHVPKDLGRILRISFPTALSEQSKIVEILSTVDEAIEGTEKLIAKHQQIKAGLMHDLFTRGLTPDGRLRPPQAEAPHLYKYSPLGPIPKEWDCTTLGDACELIQDGTHLPPARVESGPLLLSVQNMIDGDFQLTAADTRVNEEFYAQMHSSWSIKPKDVLLAVVGATIGKVCRVPEDFPKFTLQRSVAVLRGKRGLLQSTYLYWYLLGTSFRAQLWTRVNQTAQPGIYLDQLAKLEVPVCASFEQTRVCAPLEEIHRNIKALKAELSKLRATKRGLMHDLLTGRVPVPILEGDDDA